MSKNKREAFEQALTDKYEIIRNGQNEYTNPIVEAMWQGYLLCSSHNYEKHNGHWVVATMSGLDGRPFFQRTPFLHGSVEKVNAEIDRRCAAEPNSTFGVYKFVRRQTKGTVRGNKEV